MPNGVRIIIKHENKFLLGLAAEKGCSLDNYWMPVGGKVDQGEDIQMAAERELFEEAMIDDSIRYIVSYETPSGDIVSYYLCEVEITGIYLIPREFQRQKWMTLEELENIENVDGNIVNAISLI